MYLAHFRDPSGEAHPLFPMPPYEGGGTSDLNQVDGCCACGENKMADSTQLGWRTLELIGGARIDKRRSPGVTRSCSGMSRPTRRRPLSSAPASTALWTWNGRKPIIGVGCHGCEHSPAQSGAVPPVPGWATHGFPFAGRSPTGATTCPVGSVPGAQECSSHSRGLGIVAGSGHPDQERVSACLTPGSRTPSTTGLPVLSRKA